MMKNLTAQVAPTTKLKESRAGLCCTAMNQMSPSSITSPVPLSMTVGSSMRVMSATILWTPGFVLCLANVPTLMTGTAQTTTTHSNLKVLRTPPSTS